MDHTYITDPDRPQLSDYEVLTRSFAMIKAKFRDHVRSKTDVAMVNDVLCKIVCHNICCLIQEPHELGIDTAFWAETSPAQQPRLN